MLAAVKPSVKAALEGLTANPSLGFGREWSAGEFSGHFEGDEDFVDECGCSRAEFFNVSGERGHVS